jgi:hypothetical protein
MTAAPWLPAPSSAGVSGAQDAAGHGRRRLQAVGGGGGALAADGPGSELAAAAHLRSLRRMRRTPLAVPEGPGAAAPGAPPQLTATLMRRDAALAEAEAKAAAVCLAPGALGSAVVAPRQLGLIPVSGSQACPLKPEAAVKCLMSFQQADLDAAAAAQADEQL